MGALGHGRPGPHVGRSSPLIRPSAVGVSSSIAGNAHRWRAWAAGSLGADTQCRLDSSQPLEDRCHDIVSSGIVLANIVPFGTAVTVQLLNADASPGFGKFHGLSLFILEFYSEFGVAGDHARGREEDHGMASTQRQMLLIECDRVAVTLRADRSERDFDVHIGTIGALAAPPEDKY